MLIPGSMLAHRDAWLVRVLLPPPRLLLLEKRIITQRHTVSTQTLAPPEQELLWLIEMMLSPLPSAEVCSILAPAPVSIVIYVNSTKQTPGLMV